MVAVAALALLPAIPGQAADDPVGGVLTPPPTYPDLVPDAKALYIGRPILGADPETGEFIYGLRHLYFDTWAQNLGTVPFDLMADNPADLATSTVSQCTSWLVAPAVCRERRQVGGTSWHQEDLNFHFEGFTRNELRKVRRDGGVDYRRRGLVAESDFDSRCFIDTTRARDDAVPVPTYTLFCDPLRQGVSPGWAHIFFAGLVGQQVLIEGLSDGRYALVVDMDPGNRFWESDDANNTVEIVVELSNNLTDVTVVERRWP